MAEERENWGTVRIDDEVLAGGFVQVPAVVIFDPDLSPGAKTTYGSLLWFAWKWGRAPDQVQWGKMLGVTSRTIKAHLAELEECGLIKRVQYGLGRPNDYIIKTITTRGKKSSLQGGRNLPFKGEENFPPSRVVDSDVTDSESLSHSASDLADAFFAAIGESRPSKTRRERAVKVIHELTAEGFDVDTIREACKLAGERNARGPDLLPHVVGEAHDRIAARKAAAVKASTVQAAADERRNGDREHQEVALAALEALSAVERERLRAECLETLPAGLSEGLKAALLPGMMAARLEQAREGGGAVR